MLRAYVGFDVTVIYLTGSTFCFAFTSVKEICCVRCYLILSNNNIDILSTLFLWLQVSRTHVVLGVTRNINKQDRGQSHRVTSFVAV